MPALRFYPKINVNVGILAANEPRLVLGCSLECPTTAMILRPIRPDHFSLKSPIKLNINEGHFLLEISDHT